MRFTRSGDGEDRATVRVDFRVGRGEVVEALALRLTGSYDPTIDGAMISRAEAERIVRDRFALQGPPEHWTEYGEEDENYQRARDAAEAVVARYWPEIRR